jgi:RNA polymerase sigma-70 factor, ECF subfamily
MSMGLPERSPEVVELFGERAPTPAESISDEVLLAGLLDGDSMAYEVLMDRFEAPLYRFFFYSHGDHELAQDQSAETFGNMVTAVHKMRGDSACLKAFVFGVARNVMRHGWRRRKMPLASEEQLARLADQGPSAYRRAAGRQAFEQAMLAIRRLEEPARQIMLLRFVEELPLAAIAEALNIPLGSVKSHIFRSRALLRQWLDPITGGNGKTGR